jgi:hypothetical protein
MNTPQHDDTSLAWAKMAAASLGTFLGAVTLQWWVQAATLVFVLLQIWILLRDKVFRRGKGKSIFEADTTRPGQL